MQDGIARIYFITRMPATATVVSATLTGAAGTVIPAGAQAADTGGNIYALASAVTIGAGGTVTGQFVSQVTGPIACAAGSLTQIYQAVPGWESVVNTADGVVGSDVETRAAFEARRAATVAGNSVNNLQAIRAAVLAVPGVLDCYATENDASSAQTIGGVSLAANSVYVCVVGGASMAVAQAIWSKKAPGCAYNGTTTVAVTDSSYAVTPPSYNVSFTYATPVPVYFNVQIANSTAVPSDAMAQIQNAILGAFAGEDGGSRAAIGQSLYASRFYAAVAALGAWAEIISIQVGTASPGAANYVTMNINQIPSTSAADITVTLV
jgi:hypothetical protein